MQTSKINVFLSLVIFCFICGCKNSEHQQAEKPQQPIEKWKKGSVFNADSAYKYIAKQVGFGPRVPNTQNHQNCGNWLVKKLENFGFKTTEQIGEVVAFNSEKLPLRNIIGKINPNSKDRVLLCAHWDTRPFADRDSININQPIMGANDGESGVGVLLEIARIVHLDSLEIGLDIIFFDVEDYGAPSYNSNFVDLNSMNDTWCLGSQYWCYNLDKEYVKPKFGILLDMVGGEDAVFPKEEISRQYSGYHLNKIWKLASYLGYGEYFKKKIAPPLTDDHTYINKLAQIPTLDIIHYDVSPFTNRFDFGKFHHTHQDNLDIIHKPTLKAVGQTLLTYLYNI